MKNEATLLPWKRYVGVTAMLLGVFYIATFGLAMYFVKGGASSIPLMIVVIMLYIAMLAFCIRYMIKTFSVAALMLITPIAPLIALILIVTMLPILEHLR